MVSETKETTFKHAISLTLSEQNSQENVSRSISSTKVVNLHIINICWFKKWGDKTHYVPPLQNVGGGLVPMSTL